MKLLERLFHSKVTPEETMVPNDGHVVFHHNVKQALMEAVAYVWSEIVSELGIMKNGCKLVSIDESEVSERCKDEVALDVLHNGMHLFCHMSTDAKAKLLHSISDRLGTPYRVEYVRAIKNN